MCVRSLREGEAPAGGCADRRHLLFRERLLSSWSATATAHDVLVIESESGDRHLLPSARELVPEIDLEARRIVCESVPGLFDPE